MFGKSKALSALIVGVATFAVLSYLDLYFNRTLHFADRQADAASRRLTLDPGLFFGPVREAYKVAQKNPALLAMLHCYCGCDRTEGHKSLLDCFRDKHGSTCEICVGEALEADKLSEQGTPVEQIRDALRQRYAPGR